MSNKTQLQTNNAKLSSLIEALEGKAAGGGSGSADVEVCKVTITSSASFHIAAYSDGPWSASTYFLGIGDVVLASQDIASPVYDINSGRSDFSAPGDITLNLYIRKGTSFMIWGASTMIISVSGTGFHAERISCSYDSVTEGVLNAAIITIYEDNAEIAVSYSYS